jgi:hypothetical protein
MSLDASAGSPGSTDSNGIADRDDDRGHNQKRFVFSRAMSKDSHQAGLGHRFASHQAWARFIHEWDLTDGENWHDKNEPSPRR